MKKFKHLLIVGIMCLASLVALFAFVKAPTKVNANATVPTGQSLDSVVDIISVSDLTFNGLSNQTMVDHGQRKNNATFNFSTANANKSMVFKFKYDVVDASNTNSIQTEIYLDDIEGVTNQDNKSGNNRMYLYGNHTYVRQYENSSWGNKELDPIPAGLHEVEFGRIALLDGDSNPTGNYYVYYSLDGVEVFSVINPYDSSKMDGSMYIYYSSGNTTNTIYDGKLTYETPQYVSISDLKKDGNYVGNSVLDKDVAYLYDISDQPTNHSTVFVANIDYRTAEDSQIYILGQSADNWDGAGYIWFQKDKTYFGITDATGTKLSSGGNKEIKYATALTAGTQHTIEYGRLAVMNGDTFTGRYHVYVKLDGFKIYGIDQVIKNDVAAGGKIHLTGSSGFDYNDAYTYETPKEINVRDLRVNNRFVGNSYTMNSATDFTYDNSDHKPNYSIVFKFNYDVVETKNNQFHFSCTGRASGATQDYKWDYGGCFILVRGEGAKGYLGKSTSTNNNNGAQEFNCTMTAGNSYNVEYGRKAVMYGNTFTGKYYTYVKVDDSIVAWGYYGIPEVCVQGNLVFITADGHNVIKDVNQDAEQLETPDEISIGDLRLNGNRFGNVVALDAAHNFSYAATAAHKSVVFKFKYEVTDLSTVSCQFHFADRYSEDYKMYAGMIWLTKDKTYLRVENAKYAESSYKFPAVGTYNVEMGKIYVTAGAYTGRYYVYLKVDGALILDYYASAMADKANIYTTGKNGGTLYDMAYVACTTSHATELIAGTPATCTTAGTNDYYYCPNCNKNYSDAEGTHEITDLEAYLPIAALGHNLVDVEAVATTCTTAGHTAGHQCTRCDYNDYETIAALGHDLVDDAAVAPTCTTAGKEAGHHCSRCDYTDGGATIAALGHDLVEDAAVAATCTTDGKTAGHHCTRCDYTDGGVTIPATGHSLELTYNVNPTCTTAGSKAYYTCTICGKHFSDSAGADEIDDLDAYLPVPALGHLMQYTAAVAATCTVDGSNAYYTCTRCNKYFTDEEGQHEIADLAAYLPVPATGHNWQWVVDTEATYTSTGLTHEECTVCHEKRNENTVIPIKDCNHEHVEKTNRVEPTCTAAGKEAYWYCSDCQKYFKDEACQLVIDDLATYGIIAATGHTPVTDEAVAPTCTATGLTAGSHCSVCNAVLTAQEVVAALGHDLVEDAAVAATCTTDGKTAGHHCTRCDYTDGGETVPATGHDYQQTVSYTYMLDGKLEIWNVCKNDATHKELVATKYINEYNTVLHATGFNNNGSTSMSGSTYTINPATATVTVNTLPSSVGAWFRFDFTRNTTTTYKYGYLVVRGNAEGLNLSAKYDTLAQDGIANNKYDGTSGNKQYKSLGTNTIVIVWDFEALGMNSKELAKVVMWAYGTTSATDVKIEILGAGMFNLNDGTAKVSEHQYAEHNQAATCTEAGYTEMKCSCGAVINHQDVPATGHTLTHVSAKDPSLTENGNIEYWTCSVCGKKFSDAQGTTEVANVALTLEEAKQISLSDLLDSSNKSIGYVLKTYGRNELTFNNSDHKANYSLVFKFKYTADEANQNQIHITNSANKWNSAGSFILNNDKGKTVNFGKSTATASDGYYNLSYAMTSGIMYEIEYGRYAIMNGETFTGYFYHYLKINGEILKDKVTQMPEDVYKGNTVFITQDAVNTLYDYNYVQDVYEEADVISISDLTKNNASIGYIMNLTKHQTYYYTATAANKSVKLQFKYIVNTQSTINCQVHFKDGWLGDSNGGIFWFRDDKNRISKPGGGYVETSKFAEVGEYTVELAKLYITSGSNQGKYLLTMTVNGKEVLSLYMEKSAMPDNNGMFFTGDNGDMLYDINFIPDTYETADQISVGDLMLNGKPFGNIATFDQAKAYSYNATAEHKSLVFKFKYEVVDVQNVDTQIHFADKYSEDYQMYAGMFWLQPDKVYMRTANETYTKYDQAPFASAGTYTVEFGKLYVSAGTNAGKYFVYMKINDVMILSCYADAMADMANIYTTGKKGDNFYDMDYAPCNGTHTLVKIDAVAHTCTTDGNTEYYWCSNCGKYFSDAAGTTEITDLSTVVDPKAHTLTHHDAAPGADCQTAGTVEYWECSVCNKKFSDANATTEIDSIVGAYGPHTLSKVDAVTPTCTEAGSIEYYQCSACGKKFSDAQGTTEITDITVPAAHTLTKVDATDPTCTEDGNIEYYLCSVCNKKFSDAAGTTEITDITVPKAHTLVKVDAKEPTCTTAGNTEHYECSVCHKTFTDATGATEVDPTIPAAHTLVKRDAVAATCTTDGNIEYYHCSECGKNFSDAAGTQQVTNVVVPKGHTLVHHDAVNATCTVAGNVEYWECSVCGKKYADANGRTEIADVTVPATGHNYGNDGVCANCGEVDLDFKPAKKGCKSSVSAGVVVFLVAGLGIIALKKKREEN